MHCIDLVSQQCGFLGFRLVREFYVVNFVWYNVINKARKSKK